MTGPGALPAIARFILLVLRTVSASLIGFALVTWLAGQFLVDPGAGLAAAPEAMAYGLGGAAVAGALAAMAGQMLTPGGLKLVTALSILIAAVLVAMVAIRFCAALNNAESGQQPPGPVTQTRAPVGGPG
jgi:hypothetical protein